MPHVDGLESSPPPGINRRPVIVMTAFSAIDTAVESIRQGAYHYLTKPFKEDELAIFLERALEKLGSARDVGAEDRSADAFLGLDAPGHSPAMRAVSERVQHVADTPAPVIILGETGTGKGLVARALHADSQRAGRAFVSLNCAALRSSSESELFGYVKGAFTGATADRAGSSPRPTGAPVPRRDRRDATVTAGQAAPRSGERHRPPGRRGEADRGRRSHHRCDAPEPRARRSRRTFREDLLYRLDVISIALPPFAIGGTTSLSCSTTSWRRPGENTRTPCYRPFRGGAGSAKRVRWPGNVRELAHTVEKLVLLGRAAEIGVEDFVDCSIRRRRARTVRVSWRHHPATGSRTPVRLLGARPDRRAPGETAEKLGVNPKTLRKWLEDTGRDED